MDEDVGLTIASVMADMAGETDRGSALIAANYLEHQLEDLLKAFLINESSEIKKLFTLHAPLGDFDSKLRIAYCLGLITQQEFHDIEIIKWIRNRFAHRIDYKSFTNADISQRCYQFQLVSIEGTLTNIRYLEKQNPGALPFRYLLTLSEPRVMFVWLVAVLCGELRSRGKEIEQRTIYQRGLVDEMVIDELMPQNSIEALNGTVVEQDNDDNLNNA